MTEDGSCCCEQRVGDDAERRARRTRSRSRTRSVEVARERAGRCKRREEMTANDQGVTSFLIIGRQLEEDG